MQNSTTLERKQNFVVVGKKLHLFFHLGTLEVQKQRILYGQMLNNIRGGGHTVIIVVVYKAHNQQIKNQIRANVDIYRCSGRGYFLHYLNGVIISISLLWLFPVQVARIYAGPGYANRALFSTHSKYIIANITITLLLSDFQNRFHIKPTIDYFILHFIICDKVFKLSILRYGVH